ncbi:MAG: DUF3108 domain-containing protein [candidate division NC10 bacterium]|nr:DUF3108 domain-containing protein [candidate division NC10 bacterium]
MEVTWKRRCDRCGRRLAMLGAFLLAVGWLLAGEVGAAAAPPPETVRVFREGERLVYDVTWMGIKAGQATLEVRGVVQMNGQEAYHLVTTAQSAPYVSAFYRIDDRNESYLEVNPQRALRFEKHLREGRYRHSSFTEYDHDRRQVSYRYLDFTPVPKGISRLEEAEKYGKYTHEEYPLSPGALDELSILYYVRGLSLVEGRVVTAKVFASRKNWDLEVKVLGHETLDTVLGRRDTLIVEPLLKFEGIFQQKGRVIVWLTNDAERTPVLMKTEIKIGSIVSTLSRREIGLAQTDTQMPKPQAP